MGNLAPLCLSCNCSETDLTWTEWRLSDRPKAVAAFVLARVRKLALAFGVNGLGSVEARCRWALLGCPAC